jgi:hypothetical protein
MVLGCHSDSNPLNASVVSWEIVDACDDGMGLQVRFFDQDSAAVWPSATTVYRVDENDSEIFVVDCVRHHDICFGATTNPGTASSWGVGIDGTETCAGCCTTCGSGSFPTDELTCP